MEISDKVFYSDIIRTENLHRNNLYDLLEIVPAKPLPLKEQKKYTCDFIPNTDKSYIPKRRPKGKVKTVRDIRAIYENDTYSYLANDLEIQQNYLLKKIRGGSSRKDNTINIAKKCLGSDAPISKPIWQMLVNLNPENHLHSRQFVLWNGRHIQVNGSVGGKHKFICNYDLANTKYRTHTKQMKTNAIKINSSLKKKGLLRNSLSIKFKPGPLRKKKFLDESYQKHNGDIELIDLPKIGLVIQPSYGTLLGPSITHFISNLRKEDGTISEKWAEFSVSVLGKFEKSDAKLVNSECLTIDLNYKCNQQRILMRKDLDSSCSATEVKNTSSISSNVLKDEHTILPIIEDMMSKLLDAVEININQDKMFSVDCDAKQYAMDDLDTIDITPHLKENKNKRKYCELDRLDVTVIRLPEKSQKEHRHTCGNMYCTLGCICDSIDCSYNFKEHCGRENCVFGCKCDFSKRKSINSLNENESNLIPGLSKIEEEINLKLAKEEQKFHQTVIVSGDKNILLKAEKRNWKSSKKYENFFKNMSLKNVNQPRRMLTISVLKLKCENIEPWCMVHNLYKCFCKGKFTESCREARPKDECPFEECSTEKLHDDSNIPVKQCSRPRVRQNTTTSEKKLVHSGLSAASSEEVCKTNISHKQHTRNEDKSASENSDYCDYYSEYNGTCSRVIAYSGRKFSNGHYQNINDKIKEMEKNDKTLHRKMMNIINVNSDKEKSETSLHKHVSENLEKRKGDTKENNVNYLTDIDSITSNDKIGEALSLRQLLPSENKLVNWLESNYKSYKTRIDQGLIKSCLEPPKLGKVALHSWDFILSRYRERKNLFLISKQTPYRIFMGVHTRNQFFESCMNINEIRFADLHKYPQTVKNLLTNAKDLKDNFCILRGLAHCWELVGSVAKVHKNDDAEENNDDISDIESIPQSNFSDISDEQSVFKCIDRVDSDIQSSIANENESTLQYPDEAELSKWFIMTVENDFSEIRFYKKGFFVKYESIVKAISVARMSSKTVRLSSQKCVDKNNGPQFGIYAIPNANEYCVFIGPYELQDSLGIETIKTILDVGKSRRTRGFWINTSKVDNLKVIDNPLSFMPLTTSKCIEAVPLENHVFEEKVVNDGESPDKLNKKDIDDGKEKSLLKPENKKIVRPITIRKTNGFYHLTTDGSLKKMTLQNPNNITLFKPVMNLNQIAVDNKVTNNSLLLSALPTKANNIENVRILSQEDNIESGPHIKISAVYSQKEEPKLNNKKPEMGMFILKPEEINRKLFERPLNVEPTSLQENALNIHEQTSSSDMSDIEDIQTDTPVATEAFREEETICLISDDEDDSGNLNENNKDTSCKNVILECTNVSALGWIWGKRMLNTRLLSFKVPGGEYSEYYTEEEAFKKLNEELSRLIGPSKPFDLNWRIVDSPDDAVGEMSTLDCVILRGESDDQVIGEPSTKPSPPFPAMSNLRTYSRKSASSTPCASPLPNKQIEEPATLTLCPVEVPDEH